MSHVWGELQKSFGEFNNKWFLKLILVKYVDIIEYVLMYFKLIS